MKLPSYLPSGYFFMGLLCALVLAALVTAGATVFMVTHPAKKILVEAPFPNSLQFDETALEARSAIVYDPTNNRILFSKNINAQLPLASITKLMTAEIVLQKKSPATVVRLTVDDLRPEGDWGLRAGDVVLLGDLLRFGLVASSNDAITAAAASLGSDYLKVMNITAVNLGLTQTYFLNPTGLDVNQGTSGGYGSAYDVARLAALFYRQHPEFFERTMQASVSIHASGRLVTARATATPLGAIPGFIGAKTGYTDLAGGNLVALFDAEVGHPLVAVVLGSSEEGRFDDMKKLVRTARNTDATPTQ